MLRAAGRSRDQRTRPSLPRRSPSRSRLLQETNAPAGVVARLWGKGRRSSGRSSLEVPRFLDSLAAGFPELWSQGAVRVADLAAPALETGFRGQSQASGICQGHRSRRGEPFGNLVVTFGFRIDLDELGLEPLAFHHGVAVAAEQRVRFAAEVHFLHGGNAVAPDLGRGLEHSRRRLRSAVVQGVAYARCEALHLKLGARPTGHVNPPGFCPSTMPVSRLWLA